jgi:hypothetical protein
MKTAHPFRARNGSFKCVDEHKWDKGLLKFEEAIKGVPYKFVRGHNG